MILFKCPSLICTVVGYEVGMAESPSTATVVSAMLRCDLVSILFGDWPSLHQYIFNVFDVLFVQFLCFNFCSSAGLKSLHKV